MEVELGIERLRLAFRHRFTRLSAAEFWRLLELDFARELRRNPPILGTFDPERELQSIRKITNRARRRAEIEEFKRKLARQRIAWARCRMFVERAIEFDYDIDLEDLIRIIAAWFSKEYGFSRSQLEAAGYVLQRRQYMREQAKALRAEFPDDFDLVEELTDVRLGDDASITISIGPMAVEVIADVETVKKLDIALRTQTEAGGEVPDDALFAAFASRLFRDEGPVLFTVVPRQRFRAGGVKAHLAHEREHHKNYLLEEAFEDEYYHEAFVGLWDLAHRVSDFELATMLLEKSLRRKRELGLVDVKDEILACLRDKREKGQHLINRFVPGGANYDYLKSTRELSSKRNDPVYQALAHKVLVHEYMLIIGKAVATVGLLEDEHGYSRREIAGLLMDKPLRQWPQTAKRLVRYQN